MTLHTRVIGKGDLPALLLHGFTRDSSMWEPLLPAWPRLRACLLDLPGHGGSPPVQGSFDDVVDQVAKVLGAHARNLPGVVLGYSMGARVALRLALRHPRLVRALVLDGVTAGITNAAERQQRVDQDAAHVRTLEAHGVEVFLRSWEELPMFEGVKRLGPDVQAALHAQRARQTAPGLASALKVLGTGSMPDMTSRVVALDATTLLISGEQDTKFTNAARALSDAMPRARHITLPGGHACHLEHPDAYAAAVGTFLNTLEDPGSHP